jgi:hypothetical protein
MKMRRPWRTRFGVWVRGYGVYRLVADLHRSGIPVTSHAVYHWAAGRRLPRLDHAAAVQRIAHGAVTVADFARLEGPPA